ncbi:MAG TPA: endonuclease Q family protein [Candidatus Nanopelagicaceae bacterium]|nr:endonuclease Q family protein [Candidatus Nanopelagicaceae bacterium]
MDSFNADLHIHSPHSIAVSKNLNLDTMVETCKKKGLDILGTGDVLQPDWLKYLEKNLKKDNVGAFSYKDIYFILQTEIEDENSIHEVVFFPDFSTVREVQKKIKPYSKNILGEWGGRPRVNLPPAELVDIITDFGAIIGPAHAFTPFKAIFRQNKYATLEQCYQDAVKKVKFLELGLSANTDLADKLESLKNISFLSNSDAHSESPRSLGREFNKIKMENPSFDELALALERKNQRKIELNVGLHPKLGKYYNMFCNKCRRRVIFVKSEKTKDTLFNGYTISEDFIKILSENPLNAKKEYINNVSKEKITCPACKEKINKNIKIKLGVSERIDVISTSIEPIHPNHRPPYVNAVPLIDIIRAVKKIKSATSVTVLKSYEKMLNELGAEFNILIDTEIEEIKKFDKNIATVIEAIRKDNVKYTPGGGGTYGQIQLEI